MNVKIEQLEESFKEEISKIISTDLRDESITFVTITDVQISSDLSYAKVYFTSINKKEQNEKALNKAAPYIKNSMFKLYDIRKMPELTFVYDTSIEYGNKIDNILKELHHE